MFPLRSCLWMLSRKGDSMTDGQGETPARRDGRGRYLKGASGNPAGKPRGCLNHATRIAAEMLGGEAETLWRVEINRALAGINVLLYRGPCQASCWLPHASHVCALLRFG